MSRNTKIILGVLAGLVLVCMCGAGVLAATGLFAAKKVVDVAGQNITSNPAEVEAIAGRIAAYELPQGFNPDYAMDIMGYSLVGFKGDDNHSHIMLMQFPASANLSVEEMEKQMQQATQSREYTYGTQELKVVETRDVTIKGQPATATIAEGKGGEEDFRQLSVAFAGNGGPALLVYAARMSAWDDAAVDAFLASIQ